MSQSGRPLWLTCAMLPDHLDMVAPPLTLSCAVAARPSLGIPGRYCPASRPAAASCRWSSWGLIRFPSNLRDTLERLHLIGCDGHW